MKTGVKFAILGLSLAAGAAGAAIPLGAAQAAPSARVIYAVDTVANRPVLDKVQYIYGGRDYCWYDGGWHGPGWYWCGYPWRRGFGWGGGYGWRGWEWHGRGWRGDRGEWHGGRGDWRGRGDWHGDHDGGWRGDHDGDHGHHH